MNKTEKENWLKSLNQEQWNYCIKKWAKLDDEINKFKIVLE